MQAHRLQVVIPASHLLEIVLPDDLPAGPAELIVLSAPVENAASGSPEPQRSGPPGADRSEQELDRLQKTLSLADKIHLLRSLTRDLAQEETSSPFKAGESYPVWSPHQSFAAAQALLDLLQTEQGPTG